MIHNLAHYRVAVQHPDVSGFELLDMLLVRDELEMHKHELTDREQMDLQAADEQLLAHAQQVYQELARITDFRYERQNRQPDPEQW